MAGNTTPAYGFVLFDSTQKVLKAEKTLRTAGYLTKVVPVPRQLSSDCGVCLRFVWDDEEGIITVLDEAGLECLGIYRRP